MRRRELLATVPTLAVATAGCSNPLSGDDGSDGRGPAETARAFFEAAIDGRIEDANALIHPDSSEEPLTEADVQELQSLDARVESTSVVSRDGDTAVIAVEISVVTGGSRTTVPASRYELRRADGEWRLYGVAESDDRGPAAPTVQWDVVEEGGTDGITAVAFTHNGGDVVEASGVAVRIGGSTASAPADAGSITAGTQIVVPLDSAGEAYGPGSELDLLWTGDGASAVIGQHTLSDATAGTLGDRLRIE